MLKFMRKLFGGAEYGEKESTPSHSYSGSSISRGDTPFMKATKMGMNPPIIRRGWLTGYYKPGVRG